MAKGIWTSVGGDVDLDVITAGAGDVLVGKTIVNKEGEPVTGSMPNNGILNATLNCEQSKVIPVGYTSGGSITANNLASQTGATATAAQILAGKTAWVNGNRLTGTMIDYSYLCTTHIPFDGSTLSGVLKDGVLIRINNGHDGDVKTYFYGGELSIRASSVNPNSIFEIWPKYSINLLPWRQIRIKGRVVPSAPSIFGYGIWGKYRKENGWASKYGGGGDLGNTSHYSGETQYFDIYIDVSNLSVEGGFKVSVYLDSKSPIKGVTLYIELIQFIA